MRHQLSSVFRYLFRRTRLLISRLCSRFNSLDTTTAASSSDTSSAEHGSFLQLLLSSISIHNSTPIGRARYEIMFIRALISHLFMFVIHFSELFFLLFILSFVFFQSIWLLLFIIVGFIGMYFSYFCFSFL
jgi:hypothetical protein